MINAGTKEVYEIAADVDEWLNFCVEHSRTYGPFTLTVKLTPDLASALLERNTSNRRISYKVNEYARDIRNDDWLHNGETIVVSDTGELNDGQHRCQAVVAAGKSITTEMTFGVSRESRRTVDTGIKRTASAHLAIAGYRDTNVLAHAAATVIAFDKHRVISRSPEVRPTSREIQNWCDAHPDMAEHVAWGRAVRKACHCSTGLFTALHYIFARKNSEAADKFFDALSSGEMLVRSDPIYQLRKFLVEEAGSRKKSPEMDIAARCIKAWNLFRRNKSVIVLTWRPRKNPDERFPMPE